MSCNNGQTHSQEGNRWGLPECPIEASSFCQRQKTCHFDAMLQTAGLKNSSFHMSATPQLLISQNGTFSS